MLNTLIEGQAALPVERYLEIWTRAAWKLTIGLSAAVVAGALLIRFAGRTIVTKTRQLLSSEPAIGRAGVAQIAVLFGFSSGLAEAAVAFGRAVAGNPDTARGFEILWMAPLAGAFATLMLVLPILLLMRRRLIALGVAVATIAALPAHAAITGSGIPIHDFAAILLALGLASLLSRSAVAHNQGFQSVLRTASIACALWIALGFAATTVGRPSLEKFRLARGGAAAEGAPDILFLILDTVRARSMSLYGYDRATTPEIDAFAATGATFENAIATAPWTLASHASMFTGRRTLELSTDFDTRLDATYATLAEVLSERGYATAGFVANMIYTTRGSGLARGFTVYRDWPITLANVVSTSALTRVPVRRIRNLLERHGEFGRKKAADVNAELLRWLDRRPADRPFFAFVNYFDAHSPYESEPPFDRRFRPTPPRFWMVRGWERLYGDEALQELVDAYDSAIANLDAEIGSLLDRMNAAGLLDNTIVILTSDHGEHLGEHRILNHGNSLYMPLLRVPLVITYPPRIPAGRRIAASVDMRDIASTVLDLVDSSTASELPGASLAPFWMDPAADSSNMHHPVIVSELLPNEFSHPDDPVNDGYMLSLVADNLHYIRDGKGVEQLFDTATDPDETIDLSPMPMWKDTLRRLRTALDSIVAADSHANASPPAAR